VAPGFSRQEIYTVSAWQEGYFRRQDTYKSKCTGQISELEVLQRLVSCCCMWKRNSQNVAATAGRLLLVAGYVNAPIVQQSKVTTSKSLIHKVHIIILFKFSFGILVIEIYISDSLSPYFLEIV